MRKVPAAAAFVLLLAVAPLVSAAAPAAAERAPRRPDITSEDSWFALHVQGGHVGWVHITRGVRKAGEDRRVVTRQEVVMRIERYGGRMEVRSTQENVETLEGAAVSVETTTVMSQDRTRIEGTFRRGKLALEIEAGGQTSESVLDWPKDGVLAYGADRLLLARSLEPGASVTYSTWSPDLGTVVRETVRVESVRPDGLVRLVTTQEGLPGQAVRSLVEPSAWRIREMEMPGLGMRMVAASEARAKDLSADLPDLGFGTMIPVERRVPDPEAADRVVYLLRPTSGTLEGLDLDDGRRQRVLGPAPGGGVRLEVRRVGAGQGRRGPAPGPSTRTPSSTLQSDSAAVRSALAEALGPEGGKGLDPRAKADRLAVWVRDAVDERALDVGFATAAEVARDRRGDCTEHAVLLAALLRAAGVPSRVRAGLLYLPDAGEGHPAFGFHMWTQAWLDGWIDLDATLGAGEADALHLALATSDLADPGGMASLAVVAPLLGALHLEILEVQTRP